MNEATIHRERRLAHLWFPGTFATPYTRYLFGESMSVGERIGLELRSAVDAGRLVDIVT